MVESIRAETKTGSTDEIPIDVTGMQRSEVEEVGGCGPRLRSRRASSRSTRARSPS